MGYLVFLFAKSGSLTLGAVERWAWQEYGCCGVGGRVGKWVYEFLEDRDSCVVLVGWFVLLCLIFVFPVFLL